MGDSCTRLAKWVWSPFLSIMGSGATAFVYNGKFNPSRYLELLQGFEINVLCCTPTEYRMMAKLDNLQEYNLEHLHSAVSAGEPLNREVVEQFRNNFNLTVRDGYGQTESTLLIGFLKTLNHDQVQWVKKSQVAVLRSLMMRDNRLKQMLKEI